MLGLFWRLLCLFRRTAYGEVILMFLSTLALVVVFCVCAFFQATKAKSAQQGRLIEKAREVRGAKARDVACVRLLVQGGCWYQGIT